MNKFYVVWSQNGNPTKKHETKESAVEEAKRLASKQNGEFFVLEAIGCAQRTDIKYEELS